MHAVVETKAYLRAAKDAGMTQEEQDDVVTLLANNPEAGDPIQGSGGCRKVRVRKPGTGKSGGYRLITFYTGVEYPVFLITVFGKNERDNLTKAERNDLAKMAGMLTAALR